jgi:hypothetical protein
LVRRRDDINTDIDENDYIVIQKGGSKVGKQGVGLAGSKDPANASASAPSPDVGERAEDSRGGWTIVIRQQARAGGTGNNSSLTAKLAKVFASTSELERKRKAEQSLANQIVALREVVT